MTFMHDLDIPPHALHAVALICNRRGLHARAAAKFVRTLAAYEAEAMVQRGEMVVAGSSIMGLMMLAAGIDSQIDIYVHGEQAEAALAALCALVADKFGEGE
jgi:phosphocarrier protein HPr